jgi:hypothetical protein
VALDLTSLVTIVQTGLLLWLGLLAAFVLRGIFTGKINTKGLLSHRGIAGDVAPERLAMLLATLGYAIFYAVNALRMVSVDSDSAGLPEIPEEVLAVFVGTNGLYLTGKIVDMRR